jgi:spore coat protein U-like protein
MRSWQALALRAVLVALSAVGWQASAQAGSCTVSSPGLAFGAYQPLTFTGKLLSADKTSDATVSVVCSSLLEGGSYSIALGPSTAGGSIAPRYLANTSGGAHMAYNVYLDAAYTSIWGDGITGSPLTGSLPVGDSSQSHTVFGRIPAGQNTLRAGSFSGSLAITLTYNP